MYQRSVFIFRRDYRLEDNLGLNTAVNASQEVIPCFIADPAQIKPHAYQSQFGLAFMLNSLIDLQQQLKKWQAELAIFYANPVNVIQQLVQQYQIQAVFFNRDYTPFSRQRDAAIQQCCQALNIDCHIIADALLNEPEQGLKADGNPYKVFTAFYQHTRTLAINFPRPLALINSRFLNIDSGFELSQLPIKIAIRIPAGRTQALIELNRLSFCIDYAIQRDFPSVDKTSHLSAHLKFGTCSIREAYYAIINQLGFDHPLIRQLYWRDFLTHLAYHYPYVFRGSFNRKYDALLWENNETYFSAWCEGRTGFPIVDAGMRQLNQTGFMHNRVRMIVASFLVKDLHIDWHWGERYFAQQLTDYDPCLNNGNWQWAASTGCDAQPYFRIFNPWLQQQKFDPNGDYIYQWLPELKTFPIKIIHQWDKKYYHCAYPKPIINHAIRAEIIKQKFKFLK
ncbi:MAG: hypothetical protein RL637_1086 [Pseudomonadota bacterium]|jgi:deoxyribodipyrimidine photo-lyase